jgi:hypothetical protein
MLQRCCKSSSRRVYPGFSASSAGQAATQRNPLHSLRFTPSSRETATQAQTGDAYVTSEVLYQLSYVGVCRDFPDSPHARRDLVQRRCSKIEVGRCCGQG